MFVKLDRYSKLNNLKWFISLKSSSNLIDTLIYFKLKIITYLKGSSIVKQHQIVFFYRCFSSNLLRMPAISLLNKTDIQSWIIWNGLNH
jgi:hypothetical protein